MYFLATTAIERFWNKQKPILFLNDGCCRFSKRAQLDSIKYTIMPNIWSENQKIEQYFSEVEKTYEKILENMVFVLNDFHSCNYSKRYWRIIIGRWLHTYIFNMYDRYQAILHALDIDSNLDTIILDKSCFVIPNDISEFYTYISDDFYNLQLYSQIFLHLRKNYPTKKLVYKTCDETNNIEYVIDNNIIRQKKDILIMNKAYFSTSVNLLLTNRCKFAIEPHFEGQPELPNFNINREFRERLQVGSTADNDFEQFVMDSIKYNIPSAYIEGYSSVKSIVYKHPVYSTLPKGILSAVSFDGDEVFKQWAAECAENGTKLIGVAHSIAMPVQLHAIDEHMERICDVFYKPGLLVSSEGKNVRIAPATRFIGRKEANCINDLSDILFVTTNVSRNITHCFKFMVNVSDEEYFDNQRVFWENLSVELRDQLKVRLYVRDYGHDCIERWKSINHNIVTETWDLPLIPRMVNSKVIICDNFQTTFTEAMVLNKPVILYWDYRKYAEFFYPEALSCFERLAEVGILHDNPISAANLLNKIYNNIDEWWSEPWRQDVRRLICKKFAGQSQNSVTIWVNEIDSIFYDNYEMNDVLSISDYFSKLPQKRIAFIGASDVSEYLISQLQKLATKEIVGVIESNEEYQGCILSGITIKSLDEVLDEKPDAIIIGCLLNIKQVENQLIEYVSGRIKIVNIARDMPENLFRGMLHEIYGDSIDIN